MLALLAGTFGLGVRAQQMEASRKSAQKMRSDRLTEDQRILHVLNRLGFGARPGDVERVKAMGLENYINQQLNPASIADLNIEAKLKDKNLPTLTMTTAELYEKYPQPGQLLRQLQRRGDLPGRSRRGSRQSREGRSQRCAKRRCQYHSDAGADDTGRDVAQRVAERYDRRPEEWRACDCEQSG